MNFIKQIYLFGLLIMLLNSCSDPSTANEQTDISNTSKTTPIIDSLDNIVESNDKKKGVESKRKFRFQETNDKQYLLPLYGIQALDDEYILTSVIDTFSIINKDLPQIETAQIIANHVSKIMGGLKIDVKIETLENDILCLNLIFIDPETEEEYYENNWSQAFATSGMSHATLLKLLPNFLQKNYQGPWIDLIRFSDSGDGIKQHEYWRYEYDGLYILE